MFAIRLSATIAVEPRIDEVCAQQACTILYTGPEFPQGVFVAWLELKGA
jgi:hypothetical protein